MNGIDGVFIDDADAKPRKLSNHTSQIWPFIHTMKIGDRIVLPSKLQPVIHIGSITSEYSYDPKLLILSNIHVQ